MAGSSHMSAVADLNLERKKERAKRLGLPAFDAEVGKEPELDRWIEQQEGVEDIRLEHFRAFLPDHSYIFIPTRELWPASSVDSRVTWPTGSTDKPMRPSKWLDRHAAVEQMTWAPGVPMLIEDRLVDAGGWIDYNGMTTFNLYRPPTIALGDPADVEPWVSHVRKVYGNDADHLIAWLAHRVQRPGEKINHAIVMGGRQGIGKDTILEPVKHAVGPWNWHEVGPPALLGRFNPFTKSVVLRVSEARDLGEVDRFAFYDHMKVYTAAPPDVLRCDEKNLREHAVLNVCGVVITTNHKTDGIYLPADDRRHYVAWSDLDKDDFTKDYWQRLWGWYANGGTRNVAAYLASFDLNDFDSKAPPPKTEAFWHIVNAARSAEEADLADVLDSLNSPAAVTLDRIIQAAKRLHPSLAQWLTDRRSRRQIPHRLDGAGYEPVRNPSDKRDGQWRIDGRRQTVYARKDLQLRDRMAAAESLGR